MFAVVLALLVWCVNECLWCFVLLVVFVIYLQICVCWFVVLFLVQLVEFVGGFGWFSSVWAGLVVCGVASYFGLFVG